MEGNSPLRYYKFTVIKIGCEKVQVEERILEEI
jgi:hypothetical protein